MDGWKRVVDFQDFNYERVAFDINFMLDEDRKALKERLKRDYVNHLHRMEGTYYFAIWNSDYQGFKKVEDIYFDSVIVDYNYDLAILKLIDGKWYYNIIQQRVVEEYMRF